MFVITQLKHTGGVHTPTCQLMCPNKQVKNNELVSLHLTNFLVILAKNTKMVLHFYILRL